MTSFSPSHASTITRAHDRARIVATTRSSILYVVALWLLGKGAMPALAQVTSNASCVAGYDVVR